MNDRRSLNQQIGTCPCPRKGCDEKEAAVYRYRERPTERQRRKAGKLYLKCPQCGTIEGTGEAFQEFILSGGTIWQSEKKPAAKTAAASREDGQEKTRTKTRSKSKPAAKPKPKPEPKPEKKARGWWDW